MQRIVFKSKNNWKLFSYLSVPLLLISYFLLDQFILDPIRYRKKQAENLACFKITIPDGYLVHGIDVSHHQKTISWEKIAAVQGGGKQIKFAFIKATEGASHKDLTYTHNWNKTRANKIIRGAYHFYLPRINSKLQANNYIKTVTLEKGDLPPVLDVEIRGNFPLPLFQKGVKNMLAELEKAYQLKPILYTSHKFYLDYLTDAQFEEYPLWIARYEKHAPHRNKIPWHFWQHNNRGRIDGISGPVDFNVFIGDLEELKAMSKGG